MGVKWNNKRANGKVDSALTAQHIGEPNRKRTADDDPYGAGKQSGKRTKPDARSAAANVRARVAEERAAPKAEPLPSLPAPRALPLPPSLPLPASLPLPSSYVPTLSTHMPVTYSYYPHTPSYPPVF